MLVTGGAGFIGCSYLRVALAADRKLRLVNLDALTYAGHEASQRDVAADFADRYRFIRGDIRDADLVRRLVVEHDVDTVVHFAAESHVDRSIDGPLDFIDTNVRGTANLLEAARAHWRDRRDVRFHHVSTDEVFGSLGTDGLFTEATPYDPSSPYSASKAASDHLVRSWHRTYGLPVTISNCSNNYGPYQFPEKLIPLMIANALTDRPLPVYGDGSNVRDWLYVEDHCSGIWYSLTRGRVGETYNIGGKNEQPNILIVDTICELLDRKQPRTDGLSYKTQKVYVKDRPGHDRRYAIDCSKIEGELLWSPKETFNTGIEKTVDWYLQNRSWCSSITEKKYKRDRLGNA
jgi:dTDP-glucose 4,6-dehydratase